MKKIYINKDILGDVITFLGKQLKEHKRLKVTAMLRSFPDNKTQIERTLRKQIYKSQQQSLIQKSFAFQAKVVWSTILALNLRSFSSQITDIDPYWNIMRTTKDRYPQFPFQFQENDGFSFFVNFTKSINSLVEHFKGFRTVCTREL